MSEEVEIQLPPPAEPGNQRAVTHGAHSMVLLAPRASEIATGLQEALGGAYQDAHHPMIQLAALALARLERAQAWLDEHGELDERGQLRPLVKVIGNLQSEARRSLEALGLTPREWAKLHVDRLRGAGLARHLRDKYGVDR